MPKYKSKGKYDAMRRAMFASMKKRGLLKSVAKKAQAKGLIGGKSRKVGKKEYWTKRKKDTAEWGFKRNK